MKPELTIKISKINDKDSAKYYPNTMRTRSSSARSSLGLIKQECQDFFKKKQEESHHNHTPRASFSKVNTPRETSKKEFFKKEEPNNTAPTIKITLIDNSRKVRTATNLEENNKAFSARNSFGGNSTRSQIGGKIQRAEIKPLVSEFVVTREEKYNPLSTRNLTFNNKEHSFSSIRPLRQAQGPQVAKGPGEADGVKEEKEPKIKIILKKKIEETPDSKFVKSHEEILKKLKTLKELADSRIDSSNLAGGEFLDSINKKSEEILAIQKTISEGDQNFDINLSEKCLKEYQKKFLELLPKKNELEKFYTSTKNLASDAAELKENIKKPTKELLSESFEEKSYIPNTAISNSTYTNLKESQKNESLNQCSIY